MPDETRQLLVVVIRGAPTLNKDQLVRDVALTLRKNVNVVNESLEKLIDEGLVVLDGNLIRWHGS